MTDLVEQKLAEFADSATVPPLDVAGLRARANARSRRRRIGAAAAGAVVIAAGGLVAPAAWTALRTDPSTQTASTLRAAAVPNEARLREVMASVGLPIRAVRSCCAGPVRRPDSTDPGSLPYVTLPWGADNRTMTAPELSNGPSEAVRVTWATVDPPLSDAEADRLARGLWPPDPNPVPDPHATEVGAPVDAANVRSAVYAYGGQLHAWAWNDDGGFAFLTAAGSPGDAPLAAKLQNAARDLIGSPVATASGAASCQGPHTGPPFALTVDGHVVEDGVHESSGDILATSGRPLHVSVAPVAADPRIDRLQVYVLPAGTQNDSTTFAQADTLALARASASGEAPRQTVVLDDAKNLRPGQYALLVVMNMPTACNPSPVGATIAMRQLRLRPSHQ